jgi:hypothetical protein
MKAAKTPGGKTGAAPPSFSTSAGRANLARALETTDREKTVVGFDRYNRPVAALVPIEAVSILAGQGEEVDPAVRAKIVRMAKLFVSSLPANQKSTRAAPQRRRKPAPAKKRSKTLKPAARAKAKGRGKR